LTTRAVTPIRRLRLLLLAASVSWIAGCAKPPPKPAPTIIQAVLSANADVNPDSRGRASPIVVRVFELKTLAAFNGADFFSLWDRENETLGPDLVARDEIQLRPGDVKKFERGAQDATRHFAVIAAYRDLERAKWRGAVAVVANQTQVVRIELDARTLTISRP
jgi:type VI secretion system protein VasD